jgi:hypothetical protein
VVLVAADLALAHASSLPQAFDPASWFGAAVQAGRAQAAQLGRERLAGLQWHENEHFLNRFPAGASPALLPPNLALLAGVRDAQAYNPLLLRRSVEYFAEINRGQTDDHWLWVTDYESPHVDRLAVRRVLAAGGEWRVTERLLASELKVAPHATQVVDVSRQRSRPSRLRVVSYLGEGTDLAQGTPVLEVLLVDESGSDQRFVLQAGVGTAEWAYDRPDVRAVVRHRQAPIALQTRLVDPVGGAYDVFQYTATLDLPAPLTLREVWLRSLTGSATVYVQQVWSDEARAPPFSVTPTGVENLEARARFSLGTGNVTVIADEPEQIVVRTASPSSTTLTIADTYYPGWRASLDGRPVDLGPVERLFRGVQVPAGEHQVELRYAPLSLQIGLWSSAVGLLTCALVAGLGAFRRASGGAPAARARAR